MIKKKSKKQKAQKSVSSKKKLKFENYKNCLEANQLKNKINHLKKSRLMWVVSEKSKKKNHQKQYINIKITAKIQKWNK